MAKVVKKKLRLKKKNFAIFVIIIITLFVLTNSLVKSIKYNLSKKEEKKIEEKPVKKEEPIEPSLPEYYIKDNEERYKKYKEKNPELSTEEIVTEVNIGLDYEYYENTKETKFPNKSYVLVNKYNYLPDGYIPENLVEIDEKYAKSGVKLVNYAADAFEKMAADAKNEGLRIIAMSTYRSYKYQVNLYNRYKKADGEEVADTYSARPGYSEHQTGLAVDVYNGKLDYTDFEKTKEFDWMQENAYKYGFILRFPKNKTKQTGYQYESWHYRYVGKKIAAYIHDNDICFEEYYVQKIENN